MIRKPKPGPVETNPSPSIKIPLQLILEPTPNEMRLLNEDELREFRRLRRILSQAAVGGPYDPREVLQQSAAENEIWRSRRQVWAKELLKNEAVY